MDLRRRLLGSLGLLLGGLLVMALIIQLHSLRGDIEAEIAASARLVGILAKAGNLPAGSPEAGAERLATAGLRHLNIRMAGQTPTASGQYPLAGWLGLKPAADGEQEVRIGEQTFYLAPNPNSEIEERLADTVRLLITLLLYSGATLLLAWWSADRALRPVRDLEAGLQRLAAGENDPALPRFALREFSQVAGAIDSLARALAESRAAQSALARQLISVQEDERRTLARDLHDEMGQTLTALNATAAYLERNASQLDASAVAECASDLRRDIRSSNEQLRMMLKSLRPHGLDASGLAEALRELLGSWQSRETGINFALDLPAIFPEIDETSALTLYRVVQEALTNVVRHSQARHCKVSIAMLDGEILARIDDDGVGLPATGTGQRSGLLGMAERLEMANGRMTTSARPGGGLRLIALLPQQAGQVKQGEER